MSLQSFADSNGNINHGAARAYMIRHYPQGQGINLANYNTGNQHYRTNCSMTTIAGNNSIRDGRTYAAYPSPPVHTSHMETAMVSGFQSRPSYNSVTHSMANEPNGTQGTMFINHAPRPSTSGNSQASPPIGHYFNVHRDNRGVVNYVDFQNYMPADLGTNPDVIRYMRNNR